jgi:hypothetical protein
VILLFTVSPARAAAYGVNLGWSRCSLTYDNVDKSFACDDNANSYSLVASFRNGFDVPDFVAVSAAIDVITSEPFVPAWFSFGVGGCRDGELMLLNVGSVAGCTNPYAGAYQGGGYIVEAGWRLDRFRVRLAWARDRPGSLSGSNLNTAFVLGMSTASTVEEPGVIPCPGCSVPACFTLNALEVFSQTQGRVRILETPDVRNWATWQGGSGHCPAATPANKATWGQVKALYR